MREETFFQKEKDHVWHSIPSHSQTGSRQCWWQMAPSLTAYSSITVAFSGSLELPLVSQPLVTSSSTIDTLAGVTPRRWPVATDLTVTGTLWSMPYTMTVWRNKTVHESLTERESVRDRKRKREGRGRERGRKLCVHLPFLHCLPYDCRDRQTTIVFTFNHNELRDHC